jgi:hypothetical protein
MTRTTCTMTPMSGMSTMTVAAWVDPVVEAHGFGPASRYIEACWLPILGPTSTWLYRRLAMGLLVEVEFEVDLVDLAVSLGLGEGMGKQSPIARAIERLIRFGAAEAHGQRLLVRRALAALTTAQLSRLSLSSFQAHQRLTGQS